MLTQRDMFNIWMMLRKKLELTDSHNEAEWYDDLGIVSIYYDIYTFEGYIVYNDKMIYFDIQTKYNENTDTHYDIEVFDVNPSNDEDFFNGHFEQTGNFKRQENGRIIPAVFQRTDGLPGYTQHFRQLLLPDALYSADFLNSVLHRYPPFVKLALRPYGNTAKRKCQADFTLRQKRIPRGIPAG